MTKKSDLLITDNISGVNQILPHSNKWAWDLFLNGCNNNWMPTDIGMQDDVTQWKSKDILTDDERLVIKRTLGFFAGSESLVANNLLLSIFKYVTDPECRQYLLRQAFEEGLHNLTVVYCCDSLGLSIDEVYRAYNTVPSIKAKDDFLMQITSDINRDGFTTKTIEGKRELLKNIFAYYIICEGIFFYSGFAMLLSLNAQQPPKMTGVCEQINYTIRDESSHIEFGTKLINKIREQYPRVWTKDFEDEILLNIEQAIELETRYADEVLPSGILGMNSEMFMEYIRFIAHRRLINLNLNSPYGSHKNPFSWMGSVIDIGKQKNLFETRVLEYSQEIKDDL